MSIIDIAHSLSAFQAEATKEAAEGALRLLSPENADTGDKVATEAASAMAIAAAAGDADGISLDSDKSSVAGSDAARDLISKVHCALAQYADFFLDCCQHICLAIDTIGGVWWGAQGTAVEQLGANGDKFIDLNVPQVADYAYDFDRVLNSADPQIRVFGFESELSD